MILRNGTSMTVAFAHFAIKREASQEGSTSIVSAVCDDGTHVDISQHASGTWDIALEGEPIEEYEPEDGDIAVRSFMAICHNHR